MRIETLRIAEAWLKDASFGVNHYIPLVPKAAEDPAIPLIGSTRSGEIAVFNEVDDLFVADRKDPPVLPAIYLMTEGGIEMVGEPEPNGQHSRQFAPFVLVARYITARGETNVAKREGEYTLRALARSMRELMKNGNAAFRIQNGVAIEAMLNPLIFFPVLEAVGANRAAGAIAINMQLRDANPWF